MENYQRLKDRLAQISDLRGAASLLAWDQETYMPQGGGPARAEQLATLEKMAHQVFISEETGFLLEEAAPEVADYPYDSDEASLVRVTRRDYEKERKIPAELIGEIARATSQGLETWAKARADSNFASFQPDLQRIFDLHRSLAQCLGFQERLYDALLDQYEPGMTLSRLEPLLAQLKAGLVPLVHAIIERQAEVDDSVLHRHYDGLKQWDVGLEVLKRMGFDFQRGRQDRSLHPFTTSFSIHDVRITTRVYEDYLPSALFGTLHECGHALYDQGVSPSLERTPLSSGTSLGIHESQSRLWENLIGRSRNFWKFFFPRLQTVFPESLSDVTLESFYRAINRVQPSLIRVEADEVTYNLHILIRLELELAVLEDQLPVGDLAEAWNSRMKNYLGITPPDDAAGVLQDVHWAQGLIGYFPTYSLGNILSVQFFDKAVFDRPAIVTQIEVGEFSELLLWLRNNVHQYGRKLLPGELVERATGKPLSTEPYLNYLETKYSEIYGL